MCGSCSTDTETVKSDTTKVNKSLERRYRYEEASERSVSNTERLMKCRTEVGEVMERNIASRKEEIIRTRASNSIASLRRN
jgi:hypothetical protein